MTSPYSVLYDHVYLNMTWLICILFMPNQTLVSVMMKNDMYIITYVYRNEVEIYCHIAENVRDEYFA